ncbi:rmlc: dtdp-4-dehydrorhamnose 3 5-epimerase [Lucifera butyrica]|uniref:dTDP-4-dehydrorhamnose 3,5-epimerase n=1 Tax=Lucifera butyrica TaxID=1351585 RepID=A0A498R5Q3_9FIRM|nr:dTDP-4-dehydrorhamnose 3,5-epimerase [Lucifera butyrica]VBB05523.1 rmlc: dtdp-4-dehydrorhamnose 3 5-epimerase [Lucifera butyrica]
MIFTETELKGAYIIELEPICDERGFFARTWCSTEFAKRDLNPKLVQCNISYNAKRGTLRGMHYQQEPFTEAKLVHCIRGAIFDAIVDLRPESQTHFKWFSIKLTADKHNMLYIPEGFAHGFLTLQDNTEVFYQMTNSYAADYASGIRWDDPIINIKWPFSPLIIAEKDRSYGDICV